MTDLCEQLTNQAGEIARAGHNGWGNTMLAAADEIARLRRDAERYRWLRENAGAWEVSKDTAEWTKCETGEKFKPRVYFTAFSTGYGGMFLDDAIDAAMAGANP